MEIVLLIEQISVVLQFSANKLKRLDYQATELRRKLGIHCYFFPLQIFLHLKHHLVLAHKFFDYKFFSAEHVFSVHVFSKYNSIRFPLQEKYKKISIVISNFFDPALFLIPLPFFKIFFNIFFFHSVL